MNRHEITEQLIACGAVAVIRMTDTQKLLKVVEAVKAGGITAIEITMTVPDAPRIIKELAQAMGDSITLGAGSVLNAEMAQQAADAGARYLVSPVTKKEIIDTAHKNDAAVIPGTFTPTEIITAVEMGADIVKIFPADILGMSFIKSVRAPIPGLKLCPTGGVTPENAGEWITAGASCVGVGTALLDKKAIAEGNYAVLTEKAKLMVGNIAKARK